EVAGHQLLQRHRLADVQRAAVGRHHPVHARGGGEFADELPSVEGSPGFGLVHVAIIARTPCPGHGARYHCPLRPWLQRMIDRPEDALLAHYDQVLGRFGDTAQGALWPNERDRQLRFDVMLDVLAGRPDTPVVLVDLGCGTGELLARIRARGLMHIDYVGIDRSAKALEL